MLCTLKAAFQLVMPWPVSNHHVRTVSADAITDLLTVQSAMACRGTMLCRCAQLSGVCAVPCMYQAISCVQTSDEAKGLGTTWVFFAVF